MFLYKYRTNNSGSTEWVVGESMEHAVELINRCSKAGSFDSKITSISLESFILTEEYVIDRERE